MLWTSRSQKKYTGYNQLTKNGKLAINPYTTEAGRGEFPSGRSRL